MGRPETRDEVRLSAQQARNLHLAVQGLLTPARARATRARVLAAIARMRLLQIDTINVVARSPYLVLFARLGDYEPRWLDDLLARGKIFECWAHEACFAPMSDFALHRHPSPLRAGHWAHKHAATARREHRDEIAGLIAHIRANGAVKSAAFQRVYDVTERVLAKAALSVDAPRLDEAELRREFVLGAVRALGIAQARWIADYFRTGRKHKDVDLQPFVDAGELMRVDVGGWEVPGYVHCENLALLRRAQRSALRATHTALLSPFDPVIWDRERASTLFGFDYRIECYLPANKRRHGYFVLPILRCGKLIGRLDAKAHRGDGTFEIKSIRLEADVRPDVAMIDDVVA